MSGTRTRSQVGPTAGHLLVLLAALAGLFAMHGMSDHGTAGPGALATTSAPMTRIVDPIGEDLISHLDHGDATPSRPGHEHDSGVAGLCMAVLIAALVIGVALSRQHHRALGAWLPQSYLKLLGFAPERVPKPPDLLALSIQRC